MKNVKGEHTNLSVCDSGLLINPNWPFIGATPDGIIFCECCGKSTLELIVSFAFKNCQMKLFILNANILIFTKYRHSCSYVIWNTDFCVCTFADGDTGTLNIFTKTTLSGIHVMPK